MKAVDETHRSLVTDLGECLFICDVELYPAVGDHVTDDWWVVDSQGALPAHY